MMKKINKLLWLLMLSLPFSTTSFSQDGLPGLSVPEQPGFGGVRGLVKPVKRATISSEIAGRITKLPHTTGEAFSKGDLLVKFDCSLYSADVASAKAENLARQKRLENNQKLFELNAISAIEVEISYAEAQKAEAEEEIAKIKAKRCSVKAPYSGRVVEIFINEYESVASDQELLSILSTEELEIELIVSSAWLAWLKPGVGFRIFIDETQLEYPAKIKQIGAAVDPVSQTIRIIGRFLSAPDKVLSGMSGTALFEGVDY